MKVIPHHRINRKNNILSTTNLESDCFEHLKTMPFKKLSPTHCQIRFHTKIKYLDVKVGVYHYLHDKYNRYGFQVEEKCFILELEKYGKESHWLYYLMPETKEERLFINKYHNNKYRFISHADPWKYEYLVDLIAINNSHDLGFSEAFGQYYKDEE